VAARRRRRRHRLRAHLHQAQAVLHGHGAGEDERGVLAQREAGAGGGGVRRRSALLRLELLHRRQAGKEERWLRVLSVVQLRLRPLQAQAEQVVAQDVLRSRKHGAHGGQVLAGCEHAHCLRALAWEQEGHARVGQARGGAGRLGRVSGDESRLVGRWAHRRAAGGGGAPRVPLLLRLALRGGLAGAPELLRVRMLVAADRRLISKQHRLENVWAGRCARRGSDAPLLPGLHRVQAVVVQRPPVAKVLVRLRLLNRWTQLAKALTELRCTSPTRALGTSLYLSSRKRRRLRTCSR